jgi:epoxyqueuosine reductase
VKDRIRQQALALGFDECRFTSAAPPESAGRFREWLAAGRHGGMTYLERQAPKRADPQLVLPGAMSLIVLGTSYHTLAGYRDTEAHGHRDTFVAQAPHRATAPGLVARYARFADYHDTVAEPLRAFSDFVSEVGGPETRSLWYVDTGPILERDFAQRAGLGFIGKHTNLISRHFGNWLFLAEVLTTLELEPDAPERNRCGSCTRCMTACPTRAIPAPFELDARRCISYLTIELKGSIPIDLRPLIGRRIFGCDDCLAVCPWNRFAREGRLMKDHARQDLSAPDLLDLMDLDEDGFRRRFHGTPLLRARRRGLLRNVCVALGNEGNPATLPALERAAHDPEPLIAEHARWAIAQIEQRAARR